MGIKVKKVTPIEKSAKQVENNCAIIKRLAGSNLDEEKMGEIGESLATGKTLEQIRMGKELGNIFDDTIDPEFSQPR